MKRFASGGPPTRASSCTSRPPVRFRLSQEEDRCRGQVERVGCQVPGHLAALHAGAMTARPVPVRRNPAFQDGPQRAELALQVVRDQAFLEDDIDQQTRCVPLAELPPAPVADHLQRALERDKASGICLPVSTVAVVLVSLSELPEGGRI